MNRDILLTAKEVFGGGDPEYSAWHTNHKPNPYWEKWKRGRPSKVKLAKRQQYHDYEKEFGILPPFKKFIMEKREPLMNENGKIKFTKRNYGHK